MIKEVIKRSGKKEPFKAEKLKKSIIKAAKEAKLSAVQAKRLAGKISRSVLTAIRKRKSVASAALRKKILSKLAKVEPKAATAWRKYERKWARRRKRR